MITTVLSNTEVTNTALLELNLLQYDIQHQFALMICSKLELSHCWFVCRLCVPSIDFIEQHKLQFNVLVFVSAELDGDIDAHHTAAATTLLVITMANITT